MDVVAFIPARYGSKRLAGKPLADIGGKSMIERVYERVRRASTVTSVTVATDDERILKAVEGFGGDAVMTSARHGCGTERIAEAAERVKAEIVLNVQGDEPLIEPELIDETAAPLLNDASVLMATARTEITGTEDVDNPNVVKVVTDSSGYALYFSRSPLPYQCCHGRDDAAPVTFKHIGIYAYRRDFLIRLSAMKPTPLEVAERLEQLRALENGFRIKVVDTNHDPLSVDTPDDLEKVRRMFE